MKQVSQFQASHQGIVAGRPGGVRAS
jgi:hypothetical protein